MAEYVLFWLLLIISVINSSTPATVQPVIADPRQLETRPDPAPTHQATQP
jgi:hypothetical protein